MRLDLSNGGYAVQYEVCSVCAWIACTSSI